MNTTHLVMFFFGGASATTAVSYDPNQGWAAKTRSNVYTANTRSNIYEAKPRSNIWTASER